MNQQLNDQKAKAQNAIRELNAIREPKQGYPGPREDESKPKKFARCPNGTRRNKKTQNCE